jgi:thiamine-phosphate pyrophosphorylase
MYRIIDANFNRCREGLRVIEDILRFYLELSFFEDFKNIRHELKKVEQRIHPKAVLARDSQRDLGQRSFEVEQGRESFHQVLTANFKRAEESLRTLEETLKIDHRESVPAIKKIRYQVYTLEKRVFEMLQKKIDLTLYLVTDSRHNPKPLEQVVEEAIRGGVSIVQLREKHLFDCEILEKGKKVLEVCRKNGVPLLIDDRADICLALDAHGVHIGQRDLPVSAVRSILGPGKIIGKSTHSLEQAREAVSEDIDYFAFGPLYATPTKDYTPVGLDKIEEVRKISRQSGKPVVFIGGITRETLEEVAGHKPGAVAVVREIMASEDPARSAADLRKKIKG